MNSLLGAALKKKPDWAMSANCVQLKTKKLNGSNMSGTPPSPSEEHMPEHAEAPMGAPQPVHMDFSLPHLIRIVTVNVLVLAELCIAMYIANGQGPEEFQPVFLKVFFSLLVPTLILASIAKRLMNRHRSPKAKQ